MFSNLMSRKLHIVIVNNHIFWVYAWSRSSGISPELSPDISPHLISVSLNVIRNMDDPGGLSFDGLADSNLSNVLVWVWARLGVPRPGLDQKTHNSRAPGMSSKFRARPERFGASMSY